MIFASSFIINHLIFRNMVMRFFMVVASVFGVLYTAQAQLGNEWQGHLATKGGHENDRMFLTDDVIWYTSSDEAGVQRFDVGTGQQELSATFPLVGMVKDTNNQLWALGPDKSLYQYIANEWQPYPVPDSVRNAVPPIGAIFNNFIALAIDANNTIWIAALYYVWRYDGQTWTKFDPTAIGVSSLVYDIKVDQNNAVWLSLNDNRSEVACYKNGTWTTYNTNTHGLPAGQKMSYTYIDDANRKWWALACDAPNFVCADSNLFLMYNDTTWTIYTQTDVGLTVEDLQHIDGIGTTFWATAEAPLALIYYDGTTWTAYNPKDYGMANLSTSVDHNFVVDANNRFWGYNYTKLFSFDGTVATPYNIGANGAYLRGTNALAATSGSGMLWLNGEVGFVNADNKTAEVIEALAFENDTSNYYLLLRNYYAQISYLGPNNIWVANTGSAETFFGLAQTDTLSLFHYNGTTWTTIPIDTQVAPYHTRTADMAVYNNQVWLTTPSQGLVHWNGSTWTSNYPAPLNGNLQKIIATPTGTLWISANNQLLEYDGTTTTVYDHTNTNMPNAAITDLYYDNNNNTLWVTTDTAGLIKYQNATWTTYNTRNSGMATNHLTALAPTPTGALWMGSRDSGLVYFDGNTTWKVINTNTPNSPMSNNSVTTLQVDRNGNLWFFNDQLLLVYREGGLINVPKLPTLQPTTQSKGYPNPFAHSSTIAYTLKQPTTVTLQIYDLQGRVVATLLQEQQQPAGQQQVQWQPTKNLPSGVYVYRISSGGQPIAVGQLHYQIGQ